MKDIDILKALLNGNHLEQKERQRAEELIHLLNVMLKHLYNTPLNKSEVIKGS